ncbi:MAG: lysine exporter LysO family protein [Firmicutes bacterium]|nr:lysine exporter LysO family protein [Bacillota bacterium]
MSWFPFVCLGSGLLFGCFNPPKIIVTLIDKLVNIALMFLMLFIGINVGVNDSVMSNLPRIGFNCALICLSAIAGSVALTVLLEKTVVPLEQLISRATRSGGDGTAPALPTGEEETGGSSLLWVIPVSICAGIVIGYLLLDSSSDAIRSKLLYGTLVILYTGVGVGMGNNKSIFRYLKDLGFKVVLLALAVLFGSLGGGVLAGIVTGVPFSISLVSSSGMGYYSMTGAFMTQNLGAEAGIYGFMVNVMRDFFTVLLLPILIRISKGSPGASGAAGNMDTMLVPIVKLQGQEIGLVAMVVGVLTSLSVPFLQPLLLSLVQ